MIKRDYYIDKIKPYTNSDLIKVITGFRRSGKSTLLELIKQELIDQGISTKQIVSINFESYENDKLKDAKILYAYINNSVSSIKGRTYIFLDEIQEVKEWEKCINSLRVDFDCDIYITGSNAKLLSSELATHLAGRYIEIKVYPFSFDEYLKAKCIKNNDEDLIENKGFIKEQFLSYVNFGGLPFLTHFDDNTQAYRQYLEDIYKSVVLKDIITRNNVRDTDMLERVINFLIGNIGHPITARSISKYFKNEGRKIAPETVLNYIEFCCNAFLFNRAKRQDVVGKKLLTINEKYYLVDHGIRQAIFGNNERDIDQVLENIVYIELKKHGYNVNIGKLDDKEIDFIATNNNRKLYIQVSYLLASKETKDREFTPLLKIADNHPKFIITMDEINQGHDGIQHLNIIDFLLSNIL